MVTDHHSPEPTEPHRTDPTTKPGTKHRAERAGRVLPDATLRGMRRFRSHGGTVPVFSAPEFFE